MTITTEYFVVFEYVVAEKRMAVWGSGITKQMAIEDATRWYDEWVQFTGKNINAPTIKPYEGASLETDVLYVIPATSRLYNAVIDLGGAVLLNLGVVDGNFVADLPRETFDHPQRLRVHKDTSVYVYGEDDDGEEWVKEVILAEPFDQILETHVSGYVVAQTYLNETIC